MPKAKKPASIIYAYVVEMDGRAMYSQFFNADMLERKIADAESLYHGVILIEEAHAGKPPVWVRSE